MAFEISRLDHHGVESGVIKDLGLIDQIDRLLDPRIQLVSATHRLVKRGKLR